MNVKVNRMYKFMKFCALDVFRFSYKVNHKHAALLVVRYTPKTYQSHIKSRFN